MKRLILVVGVLMLTGVGPASGNDTDPLMLGDANIAQHATALGADAGGNPVMRVTNTSVGAGVSGISDGGNGVEGTTTSGIGVLATVDTANIPNDATALMVNGIARFSRSGTVTMTGCRLTIAARDGAAYPGSILDTTRVLATAQGYQSGVFVAGVVTHPDVDTFTIYLSRVPTKPVAVFWMMVG